ncbi:MAG TPA: glycosyltransferase family 1 protein [Gammaproteobacteria bacterium]|nr:glycosyltransferase family 1 protein [Gammaproteobacteria bacterium]
MRLAVFSRYTRKGASSRLRMMQYGDWLAAEGFSFHVRPLFDDGYLENLYAGRSRYGSTLKAYARRFRDLYHFRNDHDVYWIEKEMFPWVPAGLEEALLPRRLPVVSDYDDAVFHRYDLHPRVMVRRFLRDKIDRVMAASALVTAGNRYLAHRARAAGAGRVEIVPTVVDINRYQPGPDNNDTSTPVIGWIGTPGTWAEYMQPMLPLLTDVADQHGAEIWAVGAGALRDLHPRLKVLPWTEETEGDLIGSMDIGIMPLSDSPWSRGKCGYKLIQYMACGLPVVASPVGVNTEIVEPNVNGFLATSQAEWRDALMHLIRDAALRRRMGFEGRRKIEAEFSLQVWAPRVAQLFREVVGQGWL